MEEEGLVVGIPSKGTALVRLARTAACAGCAAAGACHAFGSGGESAVEADDPIGVVPGNVVRLRVKGGTVLRASLILYLLPLLVLLVTGGAVRSLAARWFEPGMAQLVGVLAGLTATAAVYVVLRRFSGGRAARPVVVAVQTGDDAPGAPAGSGVDGCGGPGLG